MGSTSGGHLIDTPSVRGPAGHLTESVSDVHADVTLTVVLQAHCATDTVSTQLTMAKRNDNPWSLRPSKSNNTGIRWELIEPFLRQVQETPIDKETTGFFAGCWSSVKGLRTIVEEDGTEVLTWNHYGKALIGGEFDLPYVARKTTCPHCKALVANLPGKWASPLQQVCCSCQLEHRRILAARAARIRRRRSGEVTTPPVMQCAECGEDFLPKRSTAKFCSARCRVANHRSRVA